MPSAIQCMLHLSSREWCHHTLWSQEFILPGTVLRTEQTICPASDSFSVLQFLLEGFNENYFHQGVRLLRDLFVPATSVRLRRNELNGYPLSRNGLTLETLINTLMATYLNLAVKSEIVIFQCQKYSETAFRTVVLNTRFIAEIPVDRSLYFHDA